MSVQRGDAFLLSDGLGFGFGVVQHVDDGTAMAIIELQNRALGRAPLLAIQAGINLLRNSSEQVV